ncbi:MAG: hypothetical protein ER33_05105 [Cyanobium sp. CACIAM 14]|nr:MAG: hypothetical protein ER33_05105 [Cyanobium sp. CACIAM 14]
MPVPRTVYFPFPLWLMAVLLLGLSLVFTLVTVDLIGYAYQRIGLTPNEAFLLLLASLLGSAVNLPLLRLKGEATVQDRLVHVYGMPTMIPTIIEHQDTLVMVNLGGAVIPTVVAIHMLVQFHLYGPGLLCAALVAAIVHRFARPIPGVGIGLPALLAPVLAAASTWLFPAAPAPALAYVAGTLGTLVGADLLNLGRIRGLGAPVASIGGAGTFDGIFLTGILAVVLA